ncbi:MAG: beta-L-arabinofuranosidase domain-containing protein [Massiliimalia sp.]|jgi:hypothetical protein
MELKQIAYTPFTANELKPSGWLKRQLEIQAKGLSGNLHKIWPDIRDSAWIGGDREGWERVPYWLDGLIPLAYLLEDEELIQTAKTYIDAILSRQQEDGWICPCSLEERGTYDMWAAILIAKVLTVYADCSKDERIEPALKKLLYQFYHHIDGHTLFNWGSDRWFEALIAIFWLYERSPEDWLLQMVHKLQIQGIDWKQVIRSGIAKVPERRWTHLTHVVNLAMMLKSQALMSRLTGENPEEFAMEALELLESLHGMAVGHFTGDECLAGDSPIQGSELCSVAEAMYSYEWLFAVSGNPHWLDRLEKLAFNALPATITPDMWAHQYDQMTNQVECSILPEDHVVFGTNGPESHLFGLEPNFGCCTANFNQAWPKFALSTFFRQKGGILSAALAPSCVSTVMDGVPVTCTLDTQYPFRNTLTYTITADAPVTFTLSIRIPVFASQAFVDGAPAKPGSFFSVHQEWNGTQTVTVQLEFETHMEQRPRDMVCVWRGPLLYSVAIQERWEGREYTKDGVERKAPYCDYCVYPESKWNYAYVSDKFEVTEREFDAPFSTKQPPVMLTASMAEIPWGFHNGTCDPEPESRIPSGAPQSVTLIPYGCTNLRMTEVPFLKK